jgi:hypothetical protein
MVIMRKRLKGDFMDAIEWEFYEAGFPAITLPPLRWDAQLYLNVTFKVCRHVSGQGEPLRAVARVTSHASSTHACMQAMWHTGRLACLHPASHLHTAL